MAARARKGGAGLLRAAAAKRRKLPSGHTAISEKMATVIDRRHRLSVLPNFERGWLPKIRPVLRSRNESRPDWIVPHMIPFLGVGFPAAQEVIAESLLPMRRIDAGRSDITSILVIESSLTPKCRHLVRHLDVTVFDNFKV
jgi:hypothetical protein